ncbi:CCAAT/enhancer-binding protein gamma-like isoform X2 [Macrosteles quadrilineatus]|nr:CCAAT/enhancer-binding protein gamma-like isoform X2 [Macrosteles quadrilineatus]XP_054289426.1 CCAAT/enhancer-binding protein gamma-like isoform X2 [Macrosteles quadrilineatus]
MPSNKENSGRGRKRSQLTQYEGEKDEDYRLRRERNNEAVRKSRDKSKKKTEQTLKRVDDLKMENCILEAQIRAYRDQLTSLKAIFLEHAASGKVSSDIDIDTILRDTDIDEESSVMTTLK